MSGITSAVALWLFVINLGVAFAAGYEHRIVLSRWIRPSPDVGYGWNAAAARQDDTGRKFWASVTTVPLTLLTVVNLLLAWRSPVPLRTWWLAAAVAALADRVVTFSYFIPTMIGLLGAPDSPQAASIAAGWSSLNPVRHVTVLAAWLCSLRAFGLFHQARG
jgi:hypothetical protein